MTDTAAIPASSVLAHKGGGKIVMAALKIGITGACFWYLSRKIDTASVFSGLAIMDLRWVGLATLLLMLEMPLVAMRWRAVVNEITETGWRAPRVPMLIIVAIASSLHLLRPAPALEPSSLFFF